MKNLFRRVVSFVLEALGNYSNHLPIEIDSLLNFECQHINFLLIYLFTPQSICFATDFMQMLHTFTISIQVNFKGFIFSFLLY